MKKTLSTQSLCLISLFTALTILLAQISIPMPYGVPMTLQTLAIPLAGMVLGAKKGAYSAVLYLLLGAVGLPVFAGFSGGIAVFFGPTGGFLLSFPLMAYLAGWGMKRGTTLSLYGGLLLGSSVNFLCGTLYFSLIMAKPLGSAFFICVLPFLPGAALKIVLSKFIGTALHRSLQRVDFTSGRGA